ncbi:MAG: response regulator [Bacteroidales bacterium]
MCINKEQEIREQQRIERLRYHWYGKRILIVEDIQVNHMLLDRILRKTRAEVLWAMNGEKAVDMVKKYGNIDLVLMDIRLPVMNGYEATRKIREIRNSLPIIAQTAYVMENEKQRVLEVGCNDLITKPIRKKALLEKIALYLYNGNKVTQ